MKARKHMDEVLKREAKMAAHAECYAWSRLFLQCAYLLRKKERENERLRAALEGIAAQKKTTELVTATDVEYADFEDGYDMCIDRARAALSPLQEPRT